MEETVEPLASGRHLREVRTESLIGSQLQGVNDHGETERAESMGEAHNGGHLPGDLQLNRAQLPFGPTIEGLSQWTQLNTSLGGGLLNCGRRSSQQCRIRELSWVHLERLNESFQTNGPGVI